MHRQPQKPDQVSESSLHDQVLDLLNRDGKPVSVRELVHRLGLGRDERQELKGLLRRLIEAGEVVKIRGARIGLPARMNLVVGRLTCNPGGFGFVVPERPRAEGDIYVSAVNLKEALHGDRVVARVERETDKGSEGRIIRILERRMQRLVGRYEDDGRLGGHIVAFDRRVLHELFIPAGDSRGAAAGQMVWAEITRPPTATRNPTGRVLEVLGGLEEPGVDLKVVMAKYELPHSFPSEVEAEAAAIPSSVSDEDRRGRTDFRSWTTVTIDPESARDHDDAISLERLEEDRWRLAVHIADVAHYVREGSALDQEAYSRGTSVYFPGHVVPMLPHALSSHICSLVEGQDRLTQTVILEIDGTGAVRHTEFHDGLIRSAARLSYPQVQKIVDGDTDLRARLAPLVSDLEEMNVLARLMRKQREKRGALDLDVPEPELILGSDGNIVGIAAAERLESMRMIEEFMLAANEAVAARLSNAGVPALYRIHEPPDPEKVEEFAQLAASFGCRIPGDLEHVRSEDFQRILRQVQGKPEQKLVSYLLLRTMKLARYHEENLGHFGLAAEMYAHFTSPIRRYPDLVAHRALRGVRAGVDAEARDRLREALPEMGLHLSDRERRADEAERELIEWKKVRFMADKLGDVFTGYITGVQAFGLFVELNEVFVQGLVHVSSMANDYYRFDERGHALRGENTRRVYRLGDRVEVQIARVDLERRQIDFVLTAEGPSAGGRRAPTARPPSRPRRVTKRTPRRRRR